MLKIVYRVCCGMDVHKSFVVACIAATNEQGVTTYKSKRFSTFTGDLRRCAAWLAENNCKDVCMESTGKYWIPIYNILEHTCNIVLAHPKYVKAIRGKKTDKRDAKWIADIFKHDLVAGSFIPPPDIRQLRDLVRYRWKLTNFTTGEKNRAQNCLTVSNFKLDDVFSDVFGKAASAITARILEDPTEKITDISGFRTKGMKATDEQVLAAVDGEMCAEQAEKLRIIRSHMDSLELCKLNLESLILSTAEKYLPQFNLVMSAPGIQSFAAIGIISEIGVDMSVFPHLKSISVPGLALRRKTTSAGKKKPPESVEPEPTSSPCWCNARSVPFGAKQFPEVRNRYLALKKRRGHKKAIIAIARMLTYSYLTICSRKMSLTILNYTGRQTGLPHIVRFLLKKQFLFFNGRVIGDCAQRYLEPKYNLKFARFLGAWFYASFFGMVLRLQCFNLIPRFHR